MLCFVNHLVNMCIIYISHCFPYSPSDLGKLVFLNIFLSLQGDIATACPVIHDLFNVFLPIFLYMANKGSQLWKCNFPFAVLENDVRPTDQPTNQQTDMRVIRLHFHKHKKEEEAVIEEEKGQRTVTYLPLSIFIHICTLSFSSLLHILKNMSNLHDKYEVVRMLRICYALYMIYIYIYILSKHVCV